MNPKKLLIRVDKDTGALWLTEERLHQKPKRIADITDRIYLALATDIAREPGTSSTVREVRFNDGASIKITVEEIPPMPLADAA